MKKIDIKIISTIIVLFIMMSGCSANEDQTMISTQNESMDEVESNHEFVPALEVSFGRDETPFIMNLQDNDTSRAISRYVGSSDWNLPIYHYDDYENYEVMQYYDIPDRYDIPSNPEMITSQKAGEVFYSQPNRIVLFYRDANISGEYTRLGLFDASGEFVSAVEDNPIVEGYRNKIISIRPMDE